MATLADAGSRQTSESNPFPYSGTAPISENNPYQQAIQGGVAASKFAGVSGQVYPTAQLGPGGVAYQKQLDAQQGAGTAQLAPASIDYLNSMKAGRTSTAAQIEAGKNLPLTADASVADTPEAASPADAAAQQQAANAKQIAIDNKSKSGYGKLAQPTRQSEVNAALAPDQALLSSLPAEYQKTLSQLAPYSHLGENTSDPALNAADATVNAAVGQSNNIMEAALAQLPKDSAEYAKSVTTQPVIQALLGFGKYEQTYAGAQPQGQSQWSQGMDEIYKYLSGSSASSNGLGSPQAAASAASASTVPGSTGAGGGNA